MSLTERTVNITLAAELRKTRSRWADPSAILAEETGHVVGENKQLDILVSEIHTSPVVIETEFFAASTVEKDALSRLGLPLAKTGRSLLSSIAVKMPASLKEESSDSLPEAIRRASFDYAVFTGPGKDSFIRYPRSGWMSGSLLDLSLAAQAMSVPPEVVSKASESFIVAVTLCSSSLSNSFRRSPGLMREIAGTLSQAPRDDIAKIAVSILLNALVIQEALAGGPGPLGDVPRITSYLNSAERSLKSRVSRDWKHILSVNYWPIFILAKKVLDSIPADGSEDFMQCLADASQELLSNDMTKTHDLTSSIFQTLIADRKFLAAFYTRPSSAELMTNLVTRIHSQGNDNPWGKRERLEDLRVADFACGTGTLLSSLYRRLCRLHELTGNQAGLIHSKMMSAGIFGCDILPSAVHLTSSMLTSVHPHISYTKSRIFCAKYEVSRSNSVHIGSLDLLKEDDLSDGLTDEIKQLQLFHGDEEDVTKRVPDGSFDLVVMNPPFTRATGQEGDNRGSPNPIFAAFERSNSDQARMGEKLTRYTRGSIYAGNAGEASAFLYLAHKKLKAKGGALAVILPLTFLTGSSWQKSRDLLIDEYESIVAITIAGVSTPVISFSQDTSIGEVLVFARKGKKKTDRKVHMVVLRDAIHDTLTADMLGRQVFQFLSTDEAKKMEDGPFGGSPVKVGNDVVGEILETTDHFICIE